MSRRDRDGEPGSEEPTRRQLAKREKRDAGSRSSRVANTLMKLSEATIGKLDVDEELRDAIARARKVTSPVARRRAERALAGDLRGVDLDDLEQRLANVQATGSAEPQLFHFAERLRNRLVEEGLSAAADLPGGAADPLPLLVQNARRERDTGKPPGAGRALFRHVMAVLKAAPAAGAGERDADDD